MKDVNKIESSIKYCGNCGTELPDPNQEFCPNCRIPLKHLNIIDSLRREFGSIAGAVIKGRQIIYTTDNWDINRDVDSLLSSWFGQNARFIMVLGVKYAILEMGPERFVAMSGVGSIIATKDDDYIIIVKRSRETILNANLKKSRKLGDVQNAKKVSRYRKRLVKTTSADTYIAIDPQLKGEIQSFLKWVKDSEGLAGYINYDLQQNNTQIISELSKIYIKLRQICLIYCSECQWQTQEKDIQVCEKCGKHLLEQK